jgi:hypothetical protein
MVQQLVARLRKTGCSSSTVMKAGAMRAVPQLDQELSLYRTSGAVKLDFKVVLQV